MKNSIVPIVEGQSEVESVPILMRRLLDIWGVVNLEIGKPVRVKRNQIVKVGELERRIILAMTRPKCSAVIVILDSDDDCPKTLAPQLIKRAQQVAQNIPISVVLPKSELESWFIGSIESLKGARGISTNISTPRNPEDIRGAKEFLTRAMASKRHYIETTDQPALTALFNLDQAYRACRSFRKFFNDFNKIVENIS